MRPTPRPSETTRSPRLTLPHTGWTQAAYAAGLIIATFPFAWLGARTSSKRLLLLGALALMAIGVLIFLLVPSYAAMMCVQGAPALGPNVERFF